VSSTPRANKSEELMATCLPLSDAGSFGSVSRMLQWLLDLKGAAGIRVRGDGKANDRYTGGFRRWPCGEGDGGRASSGSIQNSNKYACVWPIVQVRRVA
jgi:hypothetical protein